MERSSPDACLGSVGIFRGRAHGDFDILAECVQTFEEPIESEEIRGLRLGEFALTDEIADFLNEMHLASKRSRLRKRSHC